MTMASADKPPTPPKPPKKMPKEPPPGFGIPEKRGSIPGDPK